MILFGFMGGFDFPHDTFAQHVILTLETRHEDVALVAANVGQLLGKTKHNDPLSFV